MNKKSWDKIETINNYSNCEILENDTILLLTYDEEVFYDQNKWDITKESKLKNVTFDDDLNQITIHGLTPHTGDSDNMSNNMRVGFQYMEAYLFWLYFDEERILVFRRLFP